MYSVLENKGFNVIVVYKVDSRKHLYRDSFLIIYSVAQCCRNILRLLKETCTDTMISVLALSCRRNRINKIIKKLKLPSFPG